MLTQDCQLAQLTRDRQLTQLTQNHVLLVYSQTPHYQSLCVLSQITFSASSTILVMCTFCFSLFHHKLFITGPVQTTFWTDGMKEIDDHRIIGLVDGLCQISGAHNNNRQMISSYCVCNQLILYITSLLQYMQHCKKLLLYLPTTIIVWLHILLILIQRM